MILGVALGVFWDALGVPRGALVGTRECLWGILGCLGDVSRNPCGCSGDPLACFDIVSFLFCCRFVIVRYCVALFIVLFCIVVYCVVLYCVILCRFVAALFKLC